MNDFIVVHQENRTGIIFKKNIDAVLERENETCLIVNGYAIYCDDEYKDVVMQVLK